MEFNNSADSSSINQIFMLHNW